jgi:hypothetical protein
MPSSPSQLPVINVNPGTNSAITNAQVDNKKIGEGLSKNGSGEDKMSEHRARVENLSLKEINDFIKKYRTLPLPNKLARTGDVYNNKITNNYNITHNHGNTTTTNNTYNHGNDEGMDDGDNGFQARPNHRVFLNDQMQGPPPEGGPQGGPPGYAPTMSNLTNQIVPGAPLPEHREYERTMHLNAIHNLLEIQNREFRELTRLMPNHQALADMIARALNSSNQTRDSNFQVAMQEMYNKLMSAVSDNMTHTLQYLNDASGSKMLNGLEQFIERLMHRLDARNHIIEQILNRPFQMTDDQLRSMREGNVLLENISGSLRQLLDQQSGPLNQPINVLPTIDNALINGWREDNNAHLARIAENIRQGQNAIQGTIREALEENNAGRRQLVNRIDSNALAIQEAIVPNQREQAEFKGFLEMLTRYVTSKGEGWEDLLDIINKSAGTNMARFNELLAEFKAKQAAELKFYSDQMAATMQAKLDAAQSLTAQQIEAFMREMKEVAARQQPTIIHNFIKGEPSDDQHPHTPPPMPAIEPVGSLNVVKLEHEDEIDQMEPEAPTVPVHGVKAERNYVTIKQERRGKAEPKIHPPPQAPDAINFSNNNGSLDVSYPQAQDIKRLASHRLAFPLSKAEIGSTEPTNPNPNATAQSQSLLAHAPRGAYEHSDFQIWMRESLSELVQEFDRKRGELHTIALEHQKLLAKNPKTPQNQVLIQGAHEVNMWRYYINTMQRAIEQGTVINSSVVDQMPERMKSYAVYQNERVIDFLQDKTLRLADQIIQAMISTDPNADTSFRFAISRMQLHNSEVFRVMHPETSTRVFDHHATSLFITLPLLQARISGLNPAIAVPLQAFTARNINWADAFTDIQISLGQASETLKTQQQAIEHALQNLGSQPIDVWTNLKNDVHTFVTPAMSTPTNGLDIKSMPQVNPVSLQLETTPMALFGPEAVSTLGDNDPAAYVSRFDYRTEGTVIAQIRSLKEAVDTMLAEPTTQVTDKILSEMQQAIDQIRTQFTQINSPTMKNKFQQQTIALEQSLSAVYHQSAANRAQNAYPQDSTSILPPVNEIESRATNTNQSGNPAMSQAVIQKIANQLTDQVRVSATGKDDPVLCAAMARVQANPYNRNLSQYNHAVSKAQRVQFAGTALAGTGANLITFKQLIQAPQAQAQTEQAQALNVVNFQQIINQNIDQRQVHQVIYQIYNKTDAFTEANQATEETGVPAITDSDDSSDVIEIPAQHTQGEAEDKSRYIEHPSMQASGLSNHHNMVMRGEGIHARYQKLLGRIDRVKEQRAQNMYELSQPGVQEHRQMLHALMSLKQRAQANPLTKEVKAENREKGEGVLLGCGICGGNEDKDDWHMSKSGEVMHESCFRERGMSKKRKLYSQDRGEAINDSSINPEARQLYASHKRARTMQLMRGGALMSIHDEYRASIPEENGHDSKILSNMLARSSNQYVAWGDEQTDDLGKKFYTHLLAQKLGSRNTITNWHAINELALRTKILSQTPIRSIKRLKTQIRLPDADSYMSLHKNLLTTPETLMQLA